MEASEQRWGDVAESGGGVGVETKIATGKVSEDGKDCGAAGVCYESSEMGGGVDHVKLE